MYASHRDPTKIQYDTLIQLPQTRLCIQTSVDLSLCASTRTVPEIESNNASVLFSTILFYISPTNYPC
jgi:hypothetical protein